MIGKANSKLRKYNAPDLAGAFEEGVRQISREEKALQRLASLGGYKMHGLSPVLLMADDFIIRRRSRPTPVVPAGFNLGHAI